MALNSKTAFFFLWEDVDDHSYSIGPTVSQAFFLTPRNLAVHCSLSRVEGNKPGVAGATIGISSISGTPINDPRDWPSDLFQASVFTVTAQAVRTSMRGSVVVENWD